MQTENFSLVADIGGTNARFALVEDAVGIPHEPRNLVCAEYPTIVDAVETYLDMVSIGRPWQAAMSVASPVTGDFLEMMNHSWSFSVAETRKSLGLKNLKVINDYTALALALPHFNTDQFIQIGGGHAVAGHAMAVLGPGTGLGVSGAIPVGDHWVPLESEGGHVTYGPINERALQIVSVMRERLEHVSYESLVSGPGLSMTYDILCRIEKGESCKLNPGAVADLAIRDKDPIAVEALSIFCGALGNVAGNLALTLGARGGVFIGGGIVLKILDFFAESDFRNRFEQHGRLTGYLCNIPTYVINTDYPAFSGAVVSLDQAYENIGVISHESSPGC